MSGSACDQWGHIVLRGVYLVSRIVHREMIVIIVMMILIRDYAARILWIQHIRVVEVLCRISVFIDH
jgi:hypothetical protein